MYKYSKILVTEILVYEQKHCSAFCHRQYQYKRQTYQKQIEKYLDIHNACPYLRFSSLYYFTVYQNLSFYIQPRTIVSSNATPLKELRIITNQGKKKESWTQNTVSHDTKKNQKQPQKNNTLDFAAFKILHYERKRNPH